MGFDLWGGIKDVGNAGLGLATGGLYGNENYGVADNIFGGVGDYFMADTRAARAQQDAAKSAEGLVGRGYERGINQLAGPAAYGAQDMMNHRQNVYGGAYSTDPSKFQTGQYQSGGFGQNAPGFNQYQMGRAPQYQSFQQGQDPGFQRMDIGQGPQFNQFNRGADPTFRDAGSEQFDFNYQQSPGFQHALQQGLGAVQGSHAAQGSRLSGGADKNIIDYATGAAAQDYGNEYNRARGAFQDDRGYRQQQSGAQNAFNQGNYQYGTNMDANQSNLANQFGQQNYQFGIGANLDQNRAASQYGQNAFQFGQNMGFQGNENMNQFGQNAFQFGANMGNQNNMWAQNMNNQNYWQGQNMGLQDRQFGAGFNRDVNQQNYNMFNQQGMQQAGLMGGLSDQGYQSNVNLSNAYIGQGDAMANAALGLGNANANRAMATRNSVSGNINDLAQIGQTGAAIYGAR